MAAETFVITGAHPSTARLDELVVELYQFGFPNASRSNLTIVIAPGDLDGAGAKERFEALVKFCEAQGAGLTYTVSS